MFKKLIMWLQSLLRKTQFDNELFAKGVKEVAKQVKSCYKSTILASPEAFYELLTVKLFEKFGHISVVRKQLNKALKFAHEQIGTIEALSKAQVNSAIDKVSSSLIKYYNEKF